MAKTKAGRIYDHLNDHFRDRLVEVMQERFGVEVESRWSIVADRLVTTRADGEDFTPEQHAFLGAYSEGYSDAMGQVSNV